MARAALPSMMAPEYLGRLIDEHGAALVLYARQWCAAPEDAVQTAFVKLSRQQPAPAEPLPWLYGAVRNAALSAGRAERRRSHHEKNAAPIQNWFIAADDSPLDAAAAAEALDHLPAEDREVIVAHLWGGLTFEQIGPLISASAATAHRRYVRGLSALREFLGEPCPTHPAT